MKKRIAIVIVIQILLLLGVIGVMAAERGPEHAGCRHAGARRWRALSELTGLGWQANGTTGGGNYRLTGIFAPGLTGNGCCCTYLPCILR